MTDQQTCPHCGAEQSTLKFDEGCVVGWNDPAHVRSKHCYKRELAAKDAEIERLKTANTTLAGMVITAIQNEREACSHIAWTHVCTDECKSDIDGSLCCIRIAEDIAMRGEVK